MANLKSAGISYGPSCYHHGVGGCSGSVEREYLTSTSPGALAHCRGPYSIKLSSALDPSLSYSSKSTAERLLLAVRNHGVLFHGGSSVSPGARDRTMGGAFEVPRRFPLRVSAEDAIMSKGRSRAG